MLKMTTVNQLPVLVFHWSLFYRLKSGSMVPTSHKVRVVHIFHIELRRWSSVVYSAKRA